MTLTRKGPFFLIALMFPAGLLSGCAGPFGAAVAPTPTTLSETVGVAAPTVNPVAAATKNGTLGTEP